MSRLGVAALLIASLLAGVARADPKIDLQQLHPPATYTSWIGLDSPLVLPHLRGAVGLFFSDGHDALVLRNSAGLVPGGELVAHQLWLEAVGSVGLWDRFELGLAVPIALYQGGDDAPPGEDLAAAIRGERGGALGDLRIDGKVSLLDHVFGGPLDPLQPKASPHRLSLALAVSLTLPTSTTALAGESNVSGRPRLVFEWAYRRLRLALQLGAIFRARAELLDLDVTHQLTWGAGVRLLTWRALEIFLESRGAVGVAPPRGGRIGAPEAPIELDAGLSYGWRIGLRAFIAGGVGLGEGYGVPTGRWLLGLRYIAPAMKRELTWAERDDDHDGILNATDRCVREFGPIENEGCPDGDLDNDGLIDRKDTCPDRPGPVDNAGCPDYDTDGDNVPDRLDKCPKEPGPLVTQGCPQADRDRDGVADAVDRCPDQPGASENDGCPDIDSDGDGVIDRADKCPFEAEIYNGVTDEDGCPDAGSALAELEAGRIAIFEPLVFDKVGPKAEKLNARSIVVISAVAALLKAHVEIKKLRVDGHTDNVGNGMLNLELSLKRAQMVRKVLVDKWKIDPARVTAQGFGSGRPLVGNATPQERARNRRIEFTILEGPRVEAPH
jgi:hypothetical protein